MRVIAGLWRGRRLRAAPGRELRPTADRVREALFSILGPWIPDAAVIDLYAGTGALGIEALSRGARSVTWVERDPRRVALIRDNLAALGVADPSPAARVVRADAAAFLRGVAPEPRLVLLADPPYRLGAPALLDWIADHPSGYAVAALEHAAAEEPGRALAERGFAHADRRAYGNVGVTVLRPPPTFHA